MSNADLSYNLFNLETRNILRSSQVSEADLNKRRQENLIPGEPLIPIAQDARIPLVLLKHNEMPQCSLLLPAGWGMAFWKQFIFAGARAGGRKPISIISISIGIDIAMLFMFYLFVSLLF